MSMSAQVALENGSNLTGGYGRGAQLGSIEPSFRMFEPSIPVVITDANGVPIEGNFQATGSTYGGSMIEVDSFNSGSLPVGVPIAHVRLK